MNRSLNFIALSGVLLCLQGCQSATPARAPAGRVKPPPPDIAAPMAVPDGPSVGVPDRPVQLSRFAFSRAAFETDFRLLIYTPDEPAARAAAELAFARIAGIERAFDPAAPDGSIARLTRAAGNSSAQPVDRDVLVVLRKAMDVARRSNGSADPVRPPGSWRDLAIDPLAGIVRLDRPAAQLDLSAYARARAADAALAVLVDRGCPAALVQVGDVVVVGDAPPGEDGWKLRLPAGHPSPGLPGTESRALSHAAVSTIHVPTNIAVIGPNALTTVPLAIAAAALGPVRGESLVQQYDGVELILAPVPAVQPRP